MQWQSNKLIGCVDRPKRDPKQATLLSLPASFINHKVEFLVDSGAERSVIPRNLVPNALLYPCGVTLTGVGGNEIQTYGQCHVSIGIKGLRRQFPVTFIAADVKPILGADFLTQHGLMLNMKSKSLHDPHTSLTATLIVYQGEIHSIHASETKSDSYLSRSFPKLIEPRTTLNCRTPVSCMPSKQRVCRFIVSPNHYLPRD